MNSPDDSDRSHETSSPKWLIRVKRHPIISVLGALVVVAAGISTILGLPDAIRSVMPVPPPPVIFDDRDLGVQTNPRYGFTFTVPLTWARQDPGNSDGYTHIDPHNALVVLRAYGSMALTDTIQQEMQQRRSFWEKDGAEVKLFQYAGQTVYTMSGDDKVVKEDAPGWIYSYTDKVGTENVTTVGRAVADSGRYVFIEAQAPSEEFDRYEASFERLLALLVVHSNCASCVN